jgi:chromosome partitioning protein
MKGGVSKTTLAVNLASHCYKQGRSNVLLIDLDPQFNASQYLMDYKKYEAHLRSGGTLADLLIDSPTLTLRRRTPRRTMKGCVFRVDASPGTRKHFDLLPSQLALSHVVKNPAQMEYRLEKLLKPIQDKYDYIFIDCAPTDSILTTMAMMASDYLLIPVRPDRFSILGYALVGETLRLFRENCQDPHGVEEIGTVFTQVTGPTDIEAECMAEIRKQAARDGSYVFASTLPVSRTFIRAVQDQTPAFETKYAREELKDSITAIVREMKSRIVELKKKRRAT